MAARHIIITHPILVQHLISPWGHTLGRLLPCPPYDILTNSSPEQVSMQALFQYQVPPSRINRLALATSFISTPLASHLGLSHRNYPVSRVNLWVVCHKPI